MGRRVGDGRTVERVTGFAARDAHGVGQMDPERRDERTILARRRGKPAQVAAVVPEGAQVEAEPAAGVDELREVVHRRRGPRDPRA